MPVSNDGALAGALTESQRLGFLGARPIAEVIDHARSFVVALDPLMAGDRVLDLGSGGGVPGLVIAHDRPDLRLVLVDRRTKRTDFLLRIVRRLGWDDHVEVLAEDASELAAQAPASFDAVVARGFGPPESTLTLATRLVRPGGWVVISEPPRGDRWAPELMASLGVERTAADGTVAVFRRG
ncbi:MAG TPA: RsmG family class I SAM-dependent methyltransferase [Ilumatobacteraceae bacterium]|nr:RsmG family class I SAM-dependent methyltransferase [Ilumatobacteraceae bacterium]